MCTCTAPPELVTILPLHSQVWLPVIRTDTCFVLQRVQGCTHIELYDHQCFADVKSNKTFMRMRRLLALSAVDQFVPWQASLIELRSKASMGKWRSWVYRLFTKLR